MEKKKWGCFSWGWLGYVFRCWGEQVKRDKTLPGFGGTPMPRISLIGEMIGIMSFRVLELGVAVGAWDFGCGVGG